MAAGSKKAIARRPGVQTKDDDPNFTLGLNAEMRELLALVYSYSGFARGVGNSLLS